MRFLGFQFRNSHVFYCVDMTLLARVENRVPYFVIPWSRREILGICRIQDWILPVLDMRAFLEDERGGVGQSLLVAESPEGWLAFAVGRLLGIFGRERVHKVIRRKSAVLPYVLHTRQGIFHVVNLRTVLHRQLQTLWTS